jgi:hypothetical protein
MTATAIIIISPILSMFHDESRANLFRHQEPVYTPGSFTSLVYSPDYKGGSPY